jgi:uncharacterized membrane protein YjgN (DUF898 family)
MPVSWVHPRGLAGLGVVNVLLRVVTLGVYNFWGKTEVRRRIWSAIRVAGQPLVYTGTGSELMRGFIAVFGLVFIPTMLIYLAAAFALGPISPYLYVVQGIMTLAFFFLYGIGIYRSQRYRLSRTTWRGIRGGMEGSASRYALRYFGSLLLMLPTFGWIAPWRANMLQRTLTQDMRFGSQPFAYDGGPGPLYKRFWVIWVIGIVLLGSVLLAIRSLFVASVVDIDPVTQAFPIAVYAKAGFIALIGWLTFAVASAWYRAGMMNHFARSTRIAGLSFSADVTANDLIAVTIKNYLTALVGGVIGAAQLMASVLFAVDGLGVQLPSGTTRAMLLTQAAFFGLALGAPLLAPVVQARTTAYIVSVLRMDGEIDPALIAQSSAQSSGGGDGLAQAFDLDAF